MVMKDQIFGCVDETGVHQPQHVESSQDDGDHR